MSRSSCLASSKSKIVGIADINNGASLLHSENLTVLAGSSKNQPESSPEKSLGKVPFL